ncbi:MAG: Nif11 domain/cupin domain-containing protein [Cyanobacteriota bacterium]
MAEEQLQQFLAKVGQLNAFVALVDQDPGLRQRLRDCSSHHQVVDLAQEQGFTIGRRWGEAETPPRGDGNLLSGDCPPEGLERVQVLLVQPELRLERIHSCRASSPKGFWYDQPELEWVLLLRGSARLQFADESEPRDLSVGETLLIPPHRRHRLLETDGPPGTIWLALFCGDGDRHGTDAPASTSLTGTPPPERS